MQEFMRDLQKLTCDFTAGQIPENTIFGYQLLLFLMSERLLHVCYSCVRCFTVEQVDEGL